MSVVLRRTGWVLGLVALAVLVVGALNLERLVRLSKVISLFDEDRIVANFASMPEIFWSSELTTGNVRDLLVAGGEADLRYAFPTPVQTEFGQVDIDQWVDDRQVTGIVVVRDGRLVAERYDNGATREDVRISWSVAKSFLSALFGVIVREGHIGSIDEPVTKYAPLLEGTAYDGATIRDVLTMSSGVTFDEDYLKFSSDINKMGRVLALGRSMDKFAAGLAERDRAPGELRQYVSIDTHVLSMVLRGATGRSVRELMSEKIIGPMGAQGPVHYTTDGEEVAFALGGLSMPTRDYARFGLMMMDRGRVDTTQVVPESWVEMSTSNVAPPSATGDPFGYGFQWWIPPRSVGSAVGREFLARGIYDQFVYVNPDRGIVIAVNSANRRFREDNSTLEWVHFFRGLSDAFSATGVDAP